MQSHARSGASVYRPPITNSARLAVISACGTVLAIVAYVSTGGLISVLSHGPVALAMLVASIGLGLPVVRWFVEADAPPSRRMLYGAGIGLGAMSLLVLGLGTIGILSRAFWIVLVSALIVAAIVQVRRMLSAMPRATEAPHEGRSAAWLLMLLAPFAAFALLAATVPPGLLWPAEGFGYDALEYHLGAPRDYLDAGRVGYLPHNIYANFPLNVEMLYLLAMILHGDPVQAGISCQLLHAMLAVLTVAAVWMALRDAGRRPAMFGAAFVGVTPFLVYLSGLAYVEHGLLFFSALSLCAAMRALRDGERRAGPAAGLFAGLACGCKYTGVVSTALPLLAALMIGRLLGARRARPVAFAAACALAFSPWLVKNAVATGNPFFPLGYAVFGASEHAWTDALAEQWSKGHQPSPADRPLQRRLVRLYDQIVASPLYGPIAAMGLASLLVAIPNGVRRLTSAPHGDGGGFADSFTAGAFASALMLVTGLACWLGLTHLVDRFAIVMIVPSAILITLVGQQLIARARNAAVVIGASALLVVAAANFTVVWRIFTTGRADDGKAAIDYLAQDFFGRTELFGDGSPVAPHLTRLNRELLAGRRVLIVADARRFYLERGADYCVVFNRNPFAEAAERLTPMELTNWLRERGYDYVYVDWTEMRRLRSTYGFWPSIDERLFEQLSAVGVTPIEDFRMEGVVARPYATLFAISPRGDGPASESRTPRAP